MKVFLFTALFLKCVTNCFCQDFSTIKSAENVLLRYYYPDAGIVVQKTFIHDDFRNPIYEIGLVIFTKSISSDDFMGPKSFLEFKDGSRLSFSEQASFNFLYQGKHEIFLRHKLSKDELEQLKSKDIKNFSILSYNNSLDKWQAEKILKAFKKVEEEQPSK